MDSTLAPDLAARRRARAIALNRWVYRLSQHWFPWTIALLSLWVILPWLAPVFMRWGWEGPARAIYGLYSLQCHQLPQRSYFLFGPQVSYPLEQIQSLWKATFDPRILRQFVGDASLGFKVAWSDRMVSAYSSIPLAGLLWWPFRKRLRPLSLGGLILLALPMAIDGGTHVLSDLVGLGQGFRYTNAWLATLTQNSLPPSFYAGDALGSFNSWMRLVTGVLFGFGVGWLLFPNLYLAFSDTARAIEAKFDSAGVEL